MTERRVSLQVGAVADADCTSEMEAVKRQTHDLAIAGCVGRRRRGPVCWRIYAPTEGLVIAARLEPRDPVLENFLRANPRGALIVATAECEA